MRLEPLAARLVLGEGFRPDDAVGSAAELVLGARQGRMAPTADRYAPLMQGAVTVHMEAPAMAVWTLVADVRNTGRFSPETFDAEWLDGITEPTVGARFRGHVKRNEIGPVYWTTCRVTACDPGREFGFAVLIGDRAVNTWHYKFTANGKRHGCHRVVQSADA